MSFRFPGADNRTTVLGATGSGKSTCGLWILSNQRLDKRPWVVIDFKREQIFDEIGFPPVQQIALSDKPPRKPGLYLVSPIPGDDARLEAFLWKLWHRENIGLYVDEAALMPDGSEAFAAILQQGRSKRIPVIACSQRPVGVARGLFTEASYFAVYRMTDKRDYRIVEGFVPIDLETQRLDMPDYHWFWYDVAANETLAMSPVPHGSEIAASLTSAIPYQPSGWHPFSWTSRPTGRSAA